MTATRRYTRERVRAWRQGADGFFAWLADIKPFIPSFKGGYELFVPEQFQVDALRRALECDSDGNFKFRTIIFSFPRRHSKTTLNALLVLWRFTTRITENICCMATSERQSQATGFKQIKQIIRNTPSLYEMIGLGNIRTDMIEYPALQNTISSVSCNVAGLYGQRITTAWITEIHAATTDEPMQILGSSLGDSLNSWLLIDSTVDATGGPLHRLETMAANGDDPSIFVRRLEYRDLQDALDHCPRWINRDWLISRQKMLLPATFATQHLNQRAAADNRLFAQADIEACKSSFSLPIDKATLEAWAGGRTWRAGCGLDRAYGWSLHGDATVLTTVAKVAGVDGQEPEYLVLNQQEITASLGVLIKKAIARDMSAYGISNASFEAYNSQDLIAWAQENGIPTDTVHATATAQIPAFTELHRIIKERRLKFSDQLDGLMREMETFTYEIVNGNPRFGNDRFHDDRIYSLVWAIYSLRTYELASFSLPNVICDNKSRNASFCYLHGDGDMVMGCSKYCASHARVNDMYLKYRRNNIDSSISLPEFFKNMVTVSGARIYASWNC